MARGLFVVLEGPDKAGKSTQASRLAAALRRKGFVVVHTREPGGTSLAEEIRGVLLRPGRPVVPLAELLLYEAARAQHVEEKILPALRAGKVVVCERFTLATLAYQARGRGLPVGTVRTLNRIATGGLTPDLTLVLDVPERRFRSRMKGRRDRLERESAAFRGRVRRGYRELGRGRGVRWVEADRSKGVVHAEILRAVKARLAGILALRASRWSLSALGGRGLEG